MKFGRRFTYGVLLALMLSVSALPSMVTEAGMSENVLDSSTLDRSTWNNPSSGVLIEDGMLVFPDDSTEYTRYITKSAAKIDEQFSKLVKMSASIKFNTLPAGKSFILGFGLASIESIAGEAGNVEVTFTNKGGIKVGVIAYDDSGKAVTVVTPKSCGISVNKTAMVQVELTTDSKIKVMVNGKSVCSGTIPVNGEGRVGLLQTGECGVEVSNLEVVHYSYERPENANVYEDFEKEALNASVLTAKMLDMYNAFPRGQMVEEYNGSQVLMFKNAASAYVGTVYQYSNFEMTFDVPYIQTETEYKEDGTIKTKGQSDFTVAFGGEQSDWDITNGWKKATDAVTFSKTAVYAYSDQENLTTALTEEYFTKQNGGFSVKLSVVDGVVTAGIKWIEEEQYHTVLNYKLSKGMRTGYVHIWTTSVGQFAIDNLKIENLDDTPNVVDTEFKSGNFVVPEDAVPEQVERVYAEAEATETNQDILWYWLIPISAVIGAIILLASFVATRGKGKKDKEVTVDES